MDNPESFESAITQLEALTESMQNQALSLEASLQAYQRGLQLVRFCRQKLNEMEQTLQMLDGEQLCDFSDFGDA